MPADKDTGYLLLLIVVFLAVAAWVKWVSPWFGIAF